MILVLSCLPSIHFAVLPVQTIGNGRCTHVNCKGGCPPFQVSNEDVVLKRIKLNIPAEHDLSGLTFVIRSGDSTAWWRDGGTFSSTENHSSSCNASVL